MNTQATDTDRAGGAQSDEPRVAAALQALSSAKSEVVPSAFNR